MNFTDEKKNKILLYINKKITTQEYAEYIDSLTNDEKYELIKAFSIAGEEAIETWKKKIKNLLSIVKE